MSEAKAGKSDTEPIAVRMSEDAARALARACDFAASLAWAVSVNPSKTTGTQRRARDAEEWLSWGAQWLCNPEARTRVE